MAAVLFCRLKKAAFFLAFFILNYAFMPSQDGSVDPMASEDEEDVRSDAATLDSENPISEAEIASELNPAKQLQGRFDSTKVVNTYLGLFSNLAQKMQDVLDKTTNIDAIKTAFKGDELNTFKANVSSDLLLEIKKAYINEFALSGLSFAEQSSAISQLDTVLQNLAVNNKWTMPTNNNPISYAVSKKLSMGQRLINRIMSAFGKNPKYKPTDHINVTKAVQDIIQEAVSVIDKVYGTRLGQNSIALPDPATRPASPSKIPEVAAGAVLPKLPSLSPRTESLKSGSSKRSAPPAGSLTSLSDAGSRQGLSDGGESLKQEFGDDENDVDLVPDGEVKTANNQASEKLSTLFDAILEINENDQRSFEQKLKDAAGIIAELEGVGVTEDEEATGPKMTPLQLRLFNEMKTYHDTLQNIFALEAEIGNLKEKSSVSAGEAENFKKLLAKSQGTRDLLGGKFAPSTLATIEENSAGAFDADAIRDALKLELNKFKMQFVDAKKNILVINEFKNTPGEQNSDLFESRSPDDKDLVYGFALDALKRSYDVGDVSLRDNDKYELYKSFRPQEQPLLQARKANFLNQDGFYKKIGNALTEFNKTKAKTPESLRKAVAELSDEDKKERILQDLVKYQLYANSADASQKPKIDAIIGLLKAQYKKYSEADVSTLERLKNEEPLDPNINVTSLFAEGRNKLNLQTILSGSDSAVRKYLSGLESSGLVRMNEVEEDDNLVEGKDLASKTGIADVTKVFKSNDEQKLINNIFADFNLAKMKKNDPEAYKNAVDRAYYYGLAEEALKGGSPQVESIITNALVRNLSDDPATKTAFDKDFKSNASKFITELVKKENVDLTPEEKRFLAVVANPNDGEGRLEYTEEDFAAAKRVLQENPQNILLSKEPVVLAAYTELKMSRGELPNLMIVRGFAGGVTRGFFVDQQKFAEEVDRANKLGERLPVVRSHPVDIVRAMLDQNGAKLDPAGFGRVMCNAFIEYRFDKNGENLKNFSNRAKTAFFVEKLTDRLTEALNKNSDDRTKQFASAEDASKIRSAIKKGLVVLENNIENVAKDLGVFDDTSRKIDSEDIARFASSLQEVKDLNLSALQGLLDPKTRQNMLKDIVDGELRFELATNLNAGTQPSRSATPATTPPGSRRPSVDPIPRGPAPVATPQGDSRVPSAESLMRSVEPVTSGLEGFRLGDPDASPERTPEESRDSATPPGSRITPTPLASPGATPDPTAGALPSSSLALDTSSSTPPGGTDRRPSSASKPSLQRRPIFAGRRPSKTN